MTVGWKVYVLAWTWLGILSVTLMGAPFVVAAVIWAAGASIAWMLGPVVSRGGWSKALGYLLSAASVVVLILGISQGIRADQFEQRAAAAQRPEGIRRRTATGVSGIQRRGAQATAAENLRTRSNRLYGAAAVLGVAGVGLWTVGIRKIGAPDPRSNARQHA